MQGVVEQRARARASEERPVITLDRRRRSWGFGRSSPDRRSSCCTRTPAARPRRWRHPGTRSRGRSSRRRPRPRPPWPPAVPSSARRRAAPALPAVRPRGIGARWRRRWAATTSRGVRGTRALQIPGSVTYAVPSPLLSCLGVSPMTSPSATGPLHCEPVSLPVY